MYSKYIVRGVSVFAFTAYGYLLKKDWDALKIRDDTKISKS